MSKKDIQMPFTWVQAQMKGRIESDKEKQKTEKKINKCMNEFLQFFRWLK